ncbi:permease [Paralimibaculum aggregatum]|uniref:Permease n=1 Tax=Paralimibaculum aggregatum TaxID=3036245 RepID=A0ABQ6LTS6_9RHOB|nr:permease [Limibaculum sp. NKW23]GMG85456.1 permease [Limibaculum sp. NKW23]
MTELVLQRAQLALGRLRRADAVWLLVLAIPLAVALLDPVRAPTVLETAIGAFAGTAPYITLAVLLIGYLKASGAEGVLAEAFRGRESRMILVAALVGGVAPFCSCEVIPFVAALLAAGAPLSAVMAFWLSSPLMDPPQFFITMGALGPEFAVGKVLFAVLVGLMGGFVMQAMVRAGAFADPLRARKTCGSCCGTGIDGRQRPVWRFWHEAPRRRLFGEAALENALFLVKWMSLAYLLEGLLIHYVPAEMIAGVVGGEGVLPVITGALVGAPAYLNGYAAPALVSGLIEQGMSPGAAMAFMMAGSVSCIPAMAAVFALVKRPVFGMYVGLGIGGAILFGLVFGAYMG